MVPILGALRALVEMWSTSINDADWADEPLLDEDDEAVEVLVELLIFHQSNGNSATAGSQPAKMDQTSQRAMHLEATAVLYILCTHETDLMLRAGEVGAVGALVSVVKNNMHSPDVVWAVNTLCMLVTHEPHQAHFIAAEGHVALVKLLQTTSHSAVGEQAARALSNCMRDHKSQLQVAAAGAAQTLVSVLHKCLQSNERQVQGLMQQACACICNLTFENDANRIKIGQVGGCEVLVRSCTHSSSYQVLEQACAAIGNICKKNRTNRQCVGLAGGCELLLRVLSMSPPETTALQAVRAIGNVAMRDPENQLKFAAGNGLRLLLQLIETLALRLASEGPCVGGHGGGGEGGESGGTEAAEEVGVEVEHGHDGADAAGVDAEAVACGGGGDGGAPRVPACVHREAVVGASSVQSGRQLTASPCVSQASGTGSQALAASRNEARAVVQHEESFLQLTLVALAAVVAHECCRAQLAQDKPTLELLQRISRVALWSETKAVASRVLTTITTVPAPEEPLLCKRMASAPLCSPTAAPVAAPHDSTHQQQHGVKQGGGDALSHVLVSVQHVAEQLTGVGVAQVAAVGDAGKRRECNEGDHVQGGGSKLEWDPEEDATGEGGEDETILDHHVSDDSCSVASSRRCCRRSSASRGSSCSRSSLRASLRSLEWEGDEEGSEEESGGTAGGAARRPERRRAERGQLGDSDYCSEGSSVRGASARSESRASSLASIFSDDVPSPRVLSDDEIDVEQQEQPEAVASTRTRDREHAPPRGSQVRALVTRRSGAGFGGAARGDKSGDKEVGEVGLGDEVHVDVDEGEGGVEVEAKSSINKLFAARALRLTVAEKGREEEGEEGEREDERESSPSAAHSGAAGVSHAVWGHPGPGARRQEVGGEGEGSSASQSSASPAATGVSSPPIMGARACDSTGPASPMSARPSASPISSHSPSAQWPPMLLTAMQGRTAALPDAAEVSALHVRKQKQRVIDAWLEVAEAQQVALLFPVLLPSRARFGG
jgi:hypothetical protein